MIACQVMPLQADFKVLKLIKAQAVSKFGIGFLILMVKTDHYSALFWDMDGTLYIGTLEFVLPIMISWKFYMTLA